MPDQQRQLHVHAKTYCTHYTVFAGWPLFLPAARMAQGSVCPFLCRKHAGIIIVFKTAEPVALFFDKGNEIFLSCDGTKYI